jgi:PPM family protein phosphatase
MSEWTIDIAGRSETGPVRSRNEDGMAAFILASGQGGMSHSVLTLTADSGPILLAVADGCGGALSGEYASSKTLEYLCTSLADLWREGEAAECLDSAIIEANAALNRDATIAPDREGMGATLTAVVVVGTTAYIAQVGDTRAYVLRKGELHQASEDQTMVRLLVRAGHILPSEAPVHPYNTVVLAAMGTRPTIAAGLSVVELKRGDRLLVCSDGLWRRVADTEIGGLLGGANDVCEACESLVALAIERGGFDNVTVLAAQVCGEAFGEPDGTPGDAVVMVLRDSLEKQLAGAAEFAGTTREEVSWSVAQPPDQTRAPSSASDKHPPVSPLAWFITLLAAALIVWIFAMATGRL